MEEQLKVALIQSSLVWENPKKNRFNFSEKIRSIPTDADLIILPEMFTTGFTMSPANFGKEEGAITLKWMQNVSKEKNAAIVGSLPFFENGVYTNRLFFVKPDESFYHYDKRHTFTLAGEDRVYKAGDKRLVLAYKGFKICPMICYDLRFPVWARNTVDFDVLIYVANWPKPRISAWNTLLKARAIENMSYCIGVNRVGVDESGYQYSGHSAVYDVLGEPLTIAKAEEIVYATLSRQHITAVREKLKFLDDRDGFSLKL